MRDETNRLDETDEDAPRESDPSRDGHARREEVGPTGVHPMSSGAEPGGETEIRPTASGGQGDVGADETGEEGPPRGGI
jgi:hypothetical protein